MLILIDIKNNKHKKIKSNNKIIDLKNMIKDISMNLKKIN